LGWWRLGWWRLGWWRLGWWRLGWWRLLVAFGAVAARGWCRVAAFELGGRYVLAVLFITICHCAWRRFISFSDGEKETEAKKPSANNRQVSVPSAQATSFWHLIARCSPDLRMFETLLLANPDTNTLRPLTLSGKHRHPWTWTASRVRSLVSCLAWRFVCCWWDGGVVSWWGIDFSAWTTRLFLEVVVRG
jgi:hypothetical protein